MNKIRFFSATKGVSLAVLIIVYCCGQAGAQDNSYAHMLTVTMNASNSLFNAQTQVNRQRENMRNAAGQSAHNGPATQQMPAKQYPITATDFQPISAPIMPDQFAKSATGVGPATQDDMRKLFQQILTAYENKARKHNFANAFAFNSAAALQVKTGTEQDDAKVNALAFYFNNVLAASPSYYTFTPMQQQMLYESLVINGGIILFLDAQGKKTNNPQLQAQARQMSDAVLKTFLGLE